MKLRLTKIIANSKTPQLQDKNTKHLNPGSAAPEITSPVKLSPIQNVQTSAPNQTLLPSPINSCVLKTPTPINSCVLKTPTRKQTIKSCLKTPRKLKKPAKKVRFDCSAKTWDGQRPEHALLERLVSNYWQKSPSVGVLNELMENRNTEMLLKLRGMLLKVIQRLQVPKKLGKHRVELIPGGGKRKIRLKPSNLPRARKLLLKVYSAHEYTVFRMEE